MTRRSLLGLAALPVLAEVHPLRANAQRLQLKHTWTTVMSSSTYRDVLYTSIHQGGIIGRGEGAGILRYGESAESGVAFVNRLAPELSRMDLRQFGKVIDWVLRQSDADWAAKAAIDIAIHDWVAQNRGLPVHALWGLDPKDAPLTTFSIGIDKAEVIRQKVREAEAYPVLKIKVGLTNDDEVIEAVRSVTKKPLRVDANEGWKDKDEAVRKINWLEKMGVEFIEQPMPAHMVEETRYVRQRVHIPIIADEACLRPADIPKLAQAYDGVNIKIDKAGGLLQGYRMIQISRSLGLKTMLGCMISSSVAITAAAQLSPLVDYADLDGNLLIANDPFTGVRVVKGKLTLPSGNGLGLTESRLRA